MSRFISIPGMNFAGERNRALPKHPGADEFYKSRSDTSHSRSGLQPGDEVTIGGEPGRVLHEERDQHTGRVITWVQRSDKSGSGTYMSEWVPGDGPRQMVLHRHRKTHD